MHGHRQKIRNSDGVAMNEKTVASVHWSFWIISAVALLWNVLGGINFLVQMNAESLAAYREVERAIIEGRPAWATGAFAIAVFGGALGCLLLLLRKSLAFYLFMASALGVMITIAHTLAVVGSTSGFGPVEIVFIVLMPVLVAAFLIWYSKLAERKGWTS